MIERVKSHMEKFGRRADVSEISADYAEDAVIEMAGTEYRGKSAIEEFFRSNYNAVGDQQFTDVVYTENEDGSIEIDWRLGPMIGGDKFWCNDEGFFVRQRVYLGSKPADW